MNPIVEQTTGPAADNPTSAQFIWGLKRSGIHLLANWLYANHGGRARDGLDLGNLHAQLYDGFRDSDAGVSFFNNCGRTNSREFSLGIIGRTDFEQAMINVKAAIFDLEDCQIAPYVTRIPVGHNVTNILLLRDPLNNLASRLRGQRLRPQVFRVDAGYIDLYDSYCREFLGWANELPNKIPVNYNRFVIDRDYRDSIARMLGVPNVDATAEVSGYGGGSSFETDPASLSHAALTTRYHHQPIPGEILRLIAGKDAIQKICLSEFGYDLGELCLQLSGRHSA